MNATGGHSYYGRTAELVRSAHTTGHLDRLLYAVVGRLVAVDAVLAALLVVFALWHGSSLLVLIPFVVVLLIATVPVTMPAAFTVANAVEARTLAHEGILVTGLSAVQEAATMEVLCIDKTGTLTENRQTLARVVPHAPDGEDGVLLLAAATCDTAAPSPLEQAILRAVAQRALAVPTRLRVVPFDPAIKRAEAYLESGGQLMRVVLGAPHAVQELAEPLAGLAEHADALAATGERVLAVAAGCGQHLSIRGLLTLGDAVRSDAPALVAALRALGVRVLMTSGDTLATARAVSRQVGLGDRLGARGDGPDDLLRYDGFANCYPEDKFRLVQALQRTGLIVGMTGDGVNDAPALKQAEVGIAVSSATDVAKAAAQVVLTRSGLADLVAVVHSGRRVYRRMLTWTIAKIARTFELAALLVVSYMVTGFFVCSLLLIALLVIMNDVVTLTLATDRATVESRPEMWNVRRLAAIGGMLAAGWVALGLGVLWTAHGMFALTETQVQTLMFAYLIYSAQASIYLARVRGRIWTRAPSVYVALATGGNAVVATLLASLGILTPAVPAGILAATAAAVVAATLLLDEIKVRALSTLQWAR